MGPFSFSWAMSLLHGPCNSETLARSRQQCISFTGVQVNRRDFLKSGTAALATFTLSSELSADNSTSGSGSRVIFGLNRNWRFRSKRAANDTAVEFDDSGFEQVTVPHTNKRLPWHSFDEKSYEFVSIYRRHFKLPQGARDRHVFIDFDGAMTAATVWINGQRLGEYK